MFARLRRARLLAVAGCLTSVPAAVAADAAPPVTSAPPVYLAPVGDPVGCGGCDAPAGPVLGGLTGLGAAGSGIGLFAPNPPWTRKRQQIDGQQQPACAVNNHPLSDWAYIRKFCGPTLIPGTCHGHFQTKWRKWEDHCPQGVGGCAPGSALGVISTDTPVIQSAPVAAPMTPAPTPPASTPLPLPMPMPLPKADEPTKPKLNDASSLLPGIPQPAPLPPLPTLPPQEARR